MPEEAATTEISGESEVGSETTTEAEPVEETVAEEQPVEDSPPETFFDPNNVPDGLQGAYKNMQSAFTKKMQGLSGDREKVEAFNAFNSDPLGEIQKYASRMGYKLSRADAQEIATPTTPKKDWEPQSWDDVLTKAKDMAKTELMKEIQPMLGEVQAMRKATIESQLSDIDPTWQQHEDKMMEVLDKHPSMKDD